MATTMSANLLKSRNGARKRVACMRRKAQKLNPWRKALRKFFWKPHQISAAVRMIVQLQRLSDGKRRVTSVAEITGMEGDIIQMQEIYKFVRTGTDPDGTIHGHHMATGIRPRFLQELLAHGVTIPPSHFDPSKPL